MIAAQTLDPVMQLCAGQTNIIKTFLKAVRGPPAPAPFFGLDIASNERASGVLFLDLTLPISLRIDLRGKRTV